MRYFIVFFSIQKPDDLGKAHSCIECRSSEFPNRSWLEESIKQQFQEEPDLVVGLSGILELSQKDYESWTA